MQMTQSVGYLPSQVPSPTIPRDPICRMEMSGQVSTLHGQLLSQQGRESMRRESKGSWAEQSRPHHHQLHDQISDSAPWVSDAVAGYDIRVWILPQFVQDSCFLQDSLPCS